MTTKNLEKVKEFLTPPILSFAIYTNKNLPDDLYQWCLKHNNGSKQTSVMYAKLMNQTQDNKNIFFFAKDKENYVAWALLSKDSDNQYNIFVLPEYREQGIGQELINYTFKSKMASFLLTDPHDKRSFSFFEKVKEKKGNKLRYTD